jgi:hypothetical protein
MGDMLFGEALELALGVGVGVVVAHAMPATPIPAPTARAVAERPRAILFLRDIGFSWICRPVTVLVICLLRDNPSVRRKVRVQLSGTFQSAVKGPRRPPGI